MGMCHLKGLEKASLDRAGTMHAKGMTTSAANCATRSRWNSSLNPLKLNPCLFRIHASSQTGTRMCPVSVAWVDAVSKASLRGA